MIRALFTAATGMTAQQLNIDATANNLANVNTTGFKRSRVDFQDLLYQSPRMPGSTTAQGAEAPTGVQVGSGVRAASTQRIFSQGEFQQTDNPLDLVVEGDGFFQVLRGDGSTAYTRAGSFRKDANGRLVNPDGFALQPDINIPAQAVNVSIGTDGTVSVTLAGGNTSQQVGTIELARFANPAGLNAIGRNLFLPTAASGNAVTGAPGSQGFGTLSQGFIEMSNVKVVEEMVNLIIGQRAYEAGSKAVQSSDEMLQQANNMRR
jgi:flagellar basal-body rod protein FlgG